MARSKRAGARRQVLSQLSEVKRSIDKLRLWWTAETTVFQEPENRQPGDSSHLRPREEHEYPENRVEYWASTVQEIDVLLVHLGQLRSHCLTEWHKTERGVS